MPKVDYNDGAREYRQARTLPPEILDAWRAAVHETGIAAGTSRRGVVLDLGAGTGQFLAPLGEWLGRTVVAVEPSEAMRAEAVRTGLAERFSIVAGTAEALPLRRGTVAVAWLSTVIHQFTDRAAAARELRRVVTPEGAVLVRGFFSDLPITGLLGSFPGIERAATTFPSTTEIADGFRHAGFATATTLDVTERWEFDAATWAERARSIRHIDSAFRPLTDDEFDAGVAMVLEQHAGRPDPLVSDTVLRLLVLRD